MQTPKQITPTGALNELAEIGARYVLQRIKELEAENAQLKVKTKGD